MEPPIARDPSRPRSETSPAGKGSSASASDRQERLRIFGKLFALYPCPSSEDGEIKMTAYLEETRTVPPLVLSHAMKRLVSSRANSYMPSVYEILRMSARVVREWHQIAEGREPNEYNPRLESSESEIDIERWLARAHEVTELRRLPAGPEGRATPEQRAAGAVLLEQLVRETDARMRGGR